MSPTDDHSFDHVEEHIGAYVLVCACGWRSSPSDKAEVVGTQWDRHRATAA